MNFYIQSSNPRIVKADVESDISLGEAIQNIYPLFAENAIIIWKDLFIPLSYKYDISLMIVDILEMLSLLIAKEEGSYWVEWPSNTFRARWELNWNKKELNVNSKWECDGKIEEERNAVGSISLSKDMFICEWKKLLSVLLTGLCNSGYNSLNLPEITKLREIEQSIDNFGILYN